jgi:hypothetical protein
MNPPPLPNQSAGPLQKLLTFIAGIALLAVGLMFSAVVVVVGVVIGLMVWGYLWWKTREVRRVMREARPGTYRHAGGDIIEGEAVVVEEVRTTERIDDAGSKR